MDAVLTMKEAAAHLKCSPDTVVRLIRSNRLQAVAIGLGSRRQRFRICESELHRYQTEGRVAAVVPAPLPPLPPAHKKSAYKPQILR